MGGINQNARHYLFGQLCIRTKQATARRRRRIGVVADITQRDPITSTRLRSAAVVGTRWIVSFESVSATAGFSMNRGKNGNWRMTAFFDPARR